MGRLFGCMSLCGGDVGGVVNSGFPLGVLLGVDGGREVLDV